MRRVIAGCLGALVILLVSHLQAAENADFSLENNSGTMLDSKGRKLSDPDFELIRIWEGQEERGLELFRGENFGAAYEMLTEPARRGFKRAQHALALMHLQGQGVERNPLVGTALFGLAAESGDKKLKREYKKLLKSLPKKYHDVVEAQKVYYIERYGVKAQGISCRSVKQVASNLRTTNCAKEPGDYPDIAWAP